MFYYYGRKKKIIKYYPKPIHDFIIEPFAGAAAYAMEYYDKNVFLFEINPKISGAWEFLIKANSSDILQLPLLKDNQSLNDPEFNNLTDPEKYVIGLFLNPGSSTPKKSPGNYCAWTEEKRKELSEDVLKVKHWTIINGDYRKASDITATWFIDPPYFNGGKYYQFHNINYQELANWCLSRKGQVIVCENEGADWLPFKPLIQLKGQKYSKMEMIYTNL